MITFINLQQANEHIGNIEQVNELQQLNLIAAYKEIAALKESCEAQRELVIGVLHEASTISSFNRQAG